jgi:hypothetical protein
MTDPGSGIGGSSREIQTGRTPPADPDFYIKWGQESAKAFVANANTALGQLLTLSTALLGGTIAFWSHVPFAQTFRFAVVAALLFTVLVCLFSAMPSEGRFTSNNAADIRDYMEHVFAYKRRRLRIAQWSLVATLLLMIAGLVLTAWQSAH